jgi:hypothetical protein
LNGEAKQDDDDDNGELAPSPVGVSSSTCLESSLFFLDGKVLCLCHLYVCAGMQFNIAIQ